MAALLHIALTIICITFSNVYALELIDGKIKLSIVTTSGCGDTVNFISQQLGDAYWEYRDFLEVEFIPWGRTRYEEDGAMWCQFGANDCWANRVHRCALSLLENQDAQVHYMTCEFSSPFPAFLQGTYFCANAMGINLIDLDYCVTTTGSVLDDAAEEKARLPMQNIDFVPAIYFNDVVDDLEAHNTARTRLKSMICFALADDPSTGVTGCEI